MYTSQFAAFIAFILSPILSICHASYFAPYVERHKIDEIVYAPNNIDNHRTMLHRLTVAGALPDIQGWPLRPSSWPHRRPPHMTLQKRHTISMQRQLSVEEGGASRLTGNRENAGGGGEEDYYKWEKDMKINRTDGGSMPVISFNSVEENTIELLVVVTRKMLLILKNRLTEYLLATIASVAQNFKHSSLKAAVKISIVDIILLDQNFAKREGLDDWSSKNHEEVMGKFCHWVNRLRTPTKNWDSAILLNVGNFKTTALGVAHYRAMCSRESSCLVVVDRGFGTADIIAHEIGHQLGAKHDFEVGSDCGLEEQPGRKRLPQKLSSRIPENADEVEIQQDTIMSGILYFELYPFRWSACSRENIRFFLSRPESSCLRTQNAKHSDYTAEALEDQTAHRNPGIRFSLNEQCALALRQRDARFCGHNSPICKQLYCYDVQRGMCLPVEAPWAEGSRCGFKRNCKLGQCLSKGETIRPVHGGWSSWDDWGVCSRPCGGGVQFSRRECKSPEPQFGGNTCLGTNVRVRSCNIQECSQQIDIRQTLCDQIGQRMNRRLEAFQPRIGGASACKLACLDGNDEVPHNVSLPSGTPCYSSGNDICIQEKCWQAGCDKVLGSEMRTDNCNVCGGDNSTCDAVSGVFHHSDALGPGAKPLALTVAVHIPQGVTNLYIRKVSRRTTPFSSDAFDDFMLLIFEELKTRIRRGETREPFAGGELYYSGSRDREEIVQIKGRTNKNINILIRVENKNTTQQLPDVEYTYYVDKGANDHLRFDPSKFPDPQYNDPLLRFLRSPRKAAAASTEESSGKELDPDIRSRLPPTTIAPVSQQVRFEWKIEDVPSKCTSCNGTFESHALCYPVFASREEASRYGIRAFQPLPARYCAAESRPSPVFRNCADTCGVRWSWKEVGGAAENAVERCSSRCGEGRIRVPLTAVCEERVHPHGAANALWRESQLGTYPCIKAELSEPSGNCMGMKRCSCECRQLRWDYSDWDECSSQCGSGTRARSVTCLDDGGKQWPISKCLTHLSIHHSMAFNVANSEALYATETAECFDTKGCNGDFEWATSAWGDCQTAGATSINTDQAVCQSSLKRRLDGTEEEHAAIAALPSGVQTRSVTCVLRSGQDGSQREAPQHYCERVHSTKPAEQQTCSKDLICFRWGTAVLSECSVSCGVGQRVGQLTCEEVRLTTSNGYHVASLSEADCLHHLGNNISLLAETSGDDVHVHILDQGSVEERIAYHRLPNIRPLAYASGGPLLVACSGPPCRVRTLEWVTQPWSDCSSTCGVGFQRRAIRCLLVERQGRLGQETIVEEKSEADCHSQEHARPTDMRLCEMKPCVNWRVGEWSQCMGACDSGVQERTVTCVSSKMAYNVLLTSVTWHSSETTPEINTTSIEQEVYETDCSAETKPAGSRLCMLQSECPFWFRGPWSSCSATCGAGRRFRQVDCRFPNGTILYHFTPTPGDRLLIPTVSRRRREVAIASAAAPYTEICKGHRPVDKSECQLGPCSENKPFWWPVISSACSGNECERGYQQRDLQCLTPDFQQVDPQQCAYSRKPRRKVPCTQQECKTYRWRADAWNRCPYSCGNHSRYRNVRCVDDLGEEYADRLCLAHLRPDSWSLCPDACPEHPISCWDQKQRSPSSRDGLYEITVQQRVVQIYCADMDTSYPREYLPLYHLNFASIRDLSETSNANCSSEKSYINSRMTESHDPSHTSLETELNDLADIEANCITTFSKLRLNLNSLKIDVFDDRYSKTMGKHFVPFASAKSCSRGTCRLGKFLINLEGTGFSVSRETEWRASDGHAFGHITRYGGATIVFGSCGGSCGGCWPDPFFQLSLNPSNTR